MSAQQMHQCAIAVMLLAACFAVFIVFLCAIAPDIQHWLHERRDRKIERLARKYYRGG